MKLHFACLELSYTSEDLTGFVSTWLVLPRHDRPLQGRFEVVESVLPSLGQNPCLNSIDLLLFVLDLLNYHFAPEACSILCFLYYQKQEILIEALARELEKVGEVYIQWTEKI